MSASVFDGDLLVRGTFRATAAALPASCVGDANVSGSSPITSAKLYHRHARTEAQASGSASTSKTVPVRVAHGSGSVVAFRAGVTVACVGAATITFDLKRNGTSILSAPVSISSAQAAYAKVDGVITSAAYVAGDVFELVVVATAGGGTVGQGAFADAVFDEAAG